MRWNAILDAVGGQARALEVVLLGGGDDAAALATLLLLEETPHPTAALAAVAAWRPAPLVRAALAPHVAPALAAWRADPQWPDRAGGAAVRGELTEGLADLVGALRADPAALHDAVAIVLRDGNDWDVGRCLESLGARGWALLDDDLRTALVRQAPPGALGWVWSALDEAQRETTVQRAAADYPFDAATIIGRIGAAWRAIDPALRRRVIDTVAGAPKIVPLTAPAWPDLTDDERERLARAVMTHRDAWLAFAVLELLGPSGRGALTAAQRAALETLARRHPAAWRVLAWRAADAGWTALTADERAAVLAAAEQAPWNAPPLLCAIDVAGWRAMSADEQARLAAAVRGSPNTLFRCPPALWGDLAGDALPPATKMPWEIIQGWRAEDAAADLRALPAAHQATVLCLAPWSWNDVAPNSARMQRLRAAWDALPDDARVALALAQPRALAVVAAGARLRGDAAAVVDAVGETVAHWAAPTDVARVRRIVSAMLRTLDRWRDWMDAFSPTDGDPSEAWAAWMNAAQRGVVPDPSLCARLAATRLAAARDRAAPRARR